MSSDPLPLSFGVELEFVFAVNTHAIAQDPAHFLNKQSGAVKGSPKTEQASDTFFDGPAINPVPLKGTQVDLGAVEFQPKLQGAEYVARILRHAGQTVRVQDEPHIDPNFKVWQVTYDKSALPDQDSLFRLFPYRITPENVSQWKFDGTELVSRVLVATEYDRGCLHAEPFQEIQRFLTALTPGPQDPWLISGSNATGLHVHIGTNPESDVREIPLTVLQHLAYILARYEEIISSFHSDQRRGYPNTWTAMYAKSNLMGIRGHNHCCGQIPLPTLTDIQEQIFAPDMTPAKLAALMGSEGFAATKGNRFKFVNWQNISPHAHLPQKPPTIEFRQHQGTLSIEEIGQWVCFLTALMRTAERRAKESTPPPSPTKPAIPWEQLTFPMREGAKYKFICTNQQDKTNEFFALLGLPRQATEYWMKRYREYSPASFTQMPYSRICQAYECDEAIFGPAQRVRDAIGDSTSKNAAEEVDFDDWGAEDSGEGSGEDQVFGSDDEDAGDPMFQD